MLCGLKAKCAGAAEPLALVTGLGGSGLLAAGLWLWPELGTALPPGGLLLPGLLAGGLLAINRILRRAPVSGLTPGAEQPFRAALSASGAAVLLLEADGRELWRQPRSTSPFGPAQDPLQPLRDRLAGKTGARARHSRDELDRLDAAARRGLTARTELFVPLPPGPAEDATEVLELSVHPLSGGGWLWRCHDITARHALADSLQHSHDRLAEALDAMPAGYFCADSDGRLRMVNARLADWLGQPAAALTGQRIADVLGRVPGPEDDEDQALLLGRNGITIPARVVHAPFDEDGETQTHAVLLPDWEDVALVTGEVFTPLPGMTTPAEAVAAAAATAAALAGRGMLTGLTSVPRVLAAAPPLQSGHGAPPAAGEAALWPIRLFSEAPIGMAVLDSDGAVLRINRCGAALLGLDALLIAPGQPPRYAGLHPIRPPGTEGDNEDDDAPLLLPRLIDADRAPIAAALQQVIRQGGAAGPLEVRLRQPGGAECAVLLTLTAGDGDGSSGENGGETGETGGLVLLHLQDVTERRNLELQFAQSQKMQAMGQLAGGVAHDFNNLLTAMIGFCDLLLQRHGPGDASFSDIMQIRQNSNRAASLVRQLLAFSRRQALQPRLIDVTDALTDLSLLLRRLLGEKVRLEMTHGRDLGQVRVDPGQFDQVIINLAVNARDAMPGGGRLEITTRRDTRQQPLHRQTEVMPPGDYLCLTVRDSGMGIAPEHLDRIFEPFFSTKEPGAGTGLGLSTVYGIVRQTGGFIFVESVPGQGSCFTLYLPRLEAGLAVSVSAAGSSNNSSPPSSGPDSSPAPLVGSSGQPALFPMAPALAALAQSLPPRAPLSGLRVLDGRDDSATAAAPDALRPLPPRPQAGGDPPAGSLAPAPAASTAPAGGASPALAAPLLPLPSRTSDVRPSAVPPAAPLLPPAPASRPDLTGVARLLLVEDEDAVRQFAARALRTKGYQVTEAECGEAALAALDPAAPPDLLITDMVMPGMDGLTLVAAIRDRCPGLPVILMSGYSETLVSGGTTGQPGQYFLPKPFSLKQLAQMVKDVTSERKE